MLEENPYDSQDYIKDEREDELAIEELLAESVLLEELEELSNSFNPFSVLKVGTTEIRHSNMIAWLLNTNASHKLGDLFFKLLLKQLFINDKEYFIKMDMDAFDIELLDYSMFYIEREYRTKDGYIDLLLKSEFEKTVIIMENKFQAGLGKGQLEKYNLYCEEYFKGYRKIYVLLSPYNFIMDTGSPQIDCWIILTYNEIISILERIITIKKDVIHPEIETFLKHYIETIRRELMGNSELEKKCENLYRRYPNAFKALENYKPDRERQIKELCLEWIRHQSGIVEDYSSKTSIFFTTKRLAESDQLTISPRFTGSKRVVLFEIKNMPSYIRLLVTIGPIDLDNTLHTEIRGKIYHSLFEGQKKIKTTDNWDWSTLPIKNLYRDYSDDMKSAKEVWATIENVLTKFIAEELAVYENKILKALDPNA